MSKTYIFSVSVNRPNAKTFGTIVCYKVLDPDNHGADSIPYAYRGQSPHNRTRNNKKLPVKWWSYTFG